MSDPGSTHALTSSTVGASPMFIEPWNTVTSCLTTTPRAVGADVARAASERNARRVEYARSASPELSNVYSSVFGLPLASMVTMLSLFGMPGTRSTDGGSARFRVVVDESLAMVSVAVSDATSMVSVASFLPLSTEREHAFAPVAAI
eukprot:Amastigsp_a2259_55.p2 type:complete len:147 gc:universal Amastigsp_a2259_55:471-31(-)